MSDISINIYGGSNQILPNATKAEQHIYGDQQAERVLQLSDSEHPLSGEAQRLAIYIRWKTSRAISPCSPPAPQPRK